MLKIDRDDQGFLFTPHTDLGRRIAPFQTYSCRHYHTRQGFFRSFPDGLTRGGRN